MGFSVENFKANLPLGGVRPTLFQVVMTNPIAPEGDEVMQFRVQSASLPASNIGVIEIPYFGRQIKVAGDRTFDPWAVTILEDEDFKVRQALETWSNAVNSHEANLRSQNAAQISGGNNYKSRAEVTQYAKTGEIIRVYQLNGIFPSVVSEVGLGWADYNQLETYQVQFQYDWWKISGGNTGSLST